MRTVLGLTSYYEQRSDDEEDIYSGNTLQASMDEFHDLFILVSQNFRGEGTLPFSSDPPIEAIAKSNGIPYRAPSSNQFFLEYTKCQKER
ncbi:hypothetical protein AVEN_208044-1 [Araneus ventricosus]|uniref:Uncharacterized protein n=1 Tax=Araneus ventricosus TaxID=182803 RepID=A0A4Y2EZZ8_ARAVE|nr:hypothetical protein AVEN_208044-1 [Araneus ventricosus]